MTVRVAASGTGQILAKDGDLSTVYGIASLSKLWALVLIHEKLRHSARQNGLSLTVLLDKSLQVPTAYVDKIYQRWTSRPDLGAPDDPFSYQPFRPEKARFCVPLEKGQTYRLRDLLEQALFFSKNDAIQAVCDHVFADTDNQGFREASTALANRLGMACTHIGDPHGLCDGDNVSTGEDFLKFLAFIVSDHLDFFRLLSSPGKGHTAEAFTGNPEWKQRKIDIFLAKTATGNDRQGNESARSLAVVASKDGATTLILILSDADPVAEATHLLKSIYV